MARRLSSLIAVIAAAVMLAGCDVVFSTPTGATSPQVDELARDARALNRGDNPNLAASILSRGQHADLRAGLSPQDALIADRAVAAAADRLDQQLPLMRALERATASPLAQKDDLTRLLQAQIAQSDFLAADDTQRALRITWPDDSLKGLTPGQMLALEHGLGGVSERPGAQLDFERYLDSIDFYGRHPWLITDGATLRQAIQEWEVGDHAAAERLLRRLTLPEALAAVRADRRFDAVVTADLQRFDVEQAADRRIKALRRELKLEPFRPRRDADLAGRWWSVVSNRSRLRLRAPSVALDLSDALHARGQEVQAQEAAEAGARRNAGWLAHEDAAIAQSRLAFRRGAFDKAQAIMDPLFSGMVTPPVGVWMAEMKLAVDEPAEALRLLTPLTGQNAQRLPMGQRLEAISLAVCAAAQTGDQLKIVSGLGYLDANAEAGIGDAITAHLCLADLDGAAALVTRMLVDPRRRHAMLILMQDWSPPGARTAWETEIDTRRRRVFARPEVVAALARVGRVERHALRLTNLIQ